MNPDEFQFDLPEAQIAQHPPAQRSGGRLMVLTGEGPRHRRITDFPALLGEHDLVVFNDTRVVPARLIGRKLPGGGRIELFLERVLSGPLALVQVGTSKTVRPGQGFQVGEVEGVVEVAEGGFFRVRFLAHDALDVFERHGLVPLPPYIRRPRAGEGGGGDGVDDAARYQTVYARHAGAVAAPTAGLHFDQALLDAIDASGARRARLTLHVGAGTFQPVRVSRVEDHVMHAERYHVDEDLAADIARTRARGGRVVAIGTTVTRALESAADGHGGVTPAMGETRLFIYPGYRFAVVDALLTNFHLPGSTLLMMVSAFAGREPVLAAYREAVAQGYRFFSYGDAMFLERA